MLSRKTAEGRDTRSRPFGRWWSVWVPESAVPAHLVVAVGQVVGQGGLGGGVHLSGLRQARLTLEVLDRRDRLGPHDAIDRALVVVQLTQFLLELHHGGGRVDRGNRG